MAITDIFMPMPIARSTLDDVPLPQMQRSAQQLGPLQQQPSVTSMVKDKAMDMGTEKALTEGSKFGMDKLSSLFASSPTPTLTALPGGPTILNASPIMQQAGPTVAKAALTSGAPTVASSALPGTLASKVAAGTLAGSGTGASLSGLASGATTSGALSGLASGAGAGAMSALGAAVPYIGLGLVAGKAFGLFKRGGHVGPLALK